MKNKISGIFGRKVILNTLLLSALAIVAVSCEKDNSITKAEAETSELALDGPELKRGRPQTAPEASSAPAPGGSSIADIASGAGFTELVGALVYVDSRLGTGLVDLFQNGTDQYTVFAPTNEAFENLYQALGPDVNGISDLSPDLVLDVLLYHVTEGRRAANSVVPPVRPRTITTLLGATFSVDKNGKITAIGSTANIGPANISASNGIIHVIDAVLLPIIP
jgi:uncharacterized surface protein with fasciclin (FAS1) repeats